MADTPALAMSNLLARMRELRDYHAEPYKYVMPASMTQTMDEAIEALSAMAADEPLVASRLQCATLADDLARALADLRNEVRMREMRETVAKAAAAPGAPAYPDLSSELSTAHENIRLCLRTIVMMGGLIDLGAP